MTTPAVLTSRPLLATTALLGALAVAAGALGGHALEGTLSADQLATWDTATRYLIWHVLAALGLGLSGRPALTRPAWVLLTGGVLFACSLYLWLLSGWRPLVMVTPVGGLVMIGGWLLLCWAVCTSGKTKVPK